MIVSAQQTRHCGKDGASPVIMSYMNNSSLKNGIAVHVFDVLLFF